MRFSLELFPNSAIEKDSEQQKTLPAAIEAGIKD
jgi:hypothetical protein